MGNGRGFAHSSVQGCAAPTPCPKAQPPPPPLPPPRRGSRAQDWLTSKQWAQSGLIPAAAQECGAGTNTEWFQSPPGWGGHHPYTASALCYSECVDGHTDMEEVGWGVLPGTADTPNIYPQPLRSPPPAWLLPTDFGPSELPVGAALTLGTPKAALLWPSAPGMGLSHCHPAWGQGTSLAVCPAVCLSCLGCASSASGAAEIYSSSHKAMATNHGVWGCAGTCSQCPPPVPSPGVALRWERSLGTGS